jgi:heme-degrading monooxygenase HmoA
MSLELRQGAEGKGKMMIRTWHGRTRIDDAAAYEQFMQVRAAPDYASVHGLVRAVFTRRDEGDVAHFLLITFWDSMAAVSAFAGQNPAKAKYYPEDDQFLLEQEADALNYTIFFDSQSGAAT